MDQKMKLACIPQQQYSDYRFNVIFNAYKWDPQVGDHNTIAKHVLLLDSDTARQLEALAEQLAEETIRMEEALLKNLPLVKELGLPSAVRKWLNRMTNYNRRDHIRLMRFDFHPTPDGWAVSEVNSDVPGGFAEASVLPQIACPYFPGYRPGIHMGDRMLQAFVPKIKECGTIAFVHATSYADDRQVMQFLSDYMNQHGYPTIFAAPDHIRFQQQKAFSIIEGQEGEVDGIVRFFPLEWLNCLSRSSHPEGYYDTITASCNHPAAILTQSKRLPLVWDRLKVEIPAWKALLPETRDPKEIPPGLEEWIYKPALGRVGEDISIKEALPLKEYQRIQKAARRHPKDWIVQRRFNSQPLISSDGQEYHLCIGVFTIDGKCGGFYGRISTLPRIDEKAQDIPVLIL